MYTIQLVHGLDAPIFLDEWAPGGVVILPDLVGCYPAGRTAGSDALDQAARAWDLRPVRFGLIDLLKVAFLREWHWTGAAWSDERRSGAGEVPELAALRRHWRAGPPLPDAAKLEVLRAVQRLTRSWGGLRRISGEVARPGASDAKVVVFDTGLVQYPQTPHPTAFLAAIGREVLSGGRR